MKKLVVIAGMIFMGAVSSVHAEKGGIAPCLATCFLGDPRIGLYMNDGKNVEMTDWLIFGVDACGSAAGNITPGAGAISIAGPLIAGFDAYNHAHTSKSFCVGFLWGRRAGTEIAKYKLRTLEILECIPIVDLYPCIALPLEAYNGKTMTQVINDEGLAR